MALDADGVPQRVELPTGEFIWVRVEVPEAAVGDGGGAGGTARDVGGRRLRRNHPSVDDEAQISKLVGFTETVGGIAHSVRKSLAAVRPDRVEVEFGLEIDGSTGKVVSMVASAHAKASIKVKLGWDQAGISDVRGVEGVDSVDSADRVEDANRSDDADDSADDADSADSADSANAEDPAEDTAQDQEP